MQFSFVDIANFRSIKKGTITAAQTNLIIGPNGSGKTSTLEALYFLIKLRSFVTRKKKTLISFEKNESTIFASLKNKNSQHKAGALFTAKGTTSKINGSKSNLKDHLGILPMVAIEPNAQDLITTTPGSKRKFLDWWVFHVEQEFLTTYIDYKRCLTNRNILLKKGANTDPWDIQISLHSNKITSFRGTLIDEINKTFVLLTEKYLNKPLHIKLNPGWPADISIQEALKASYLIDKKRGFTQNGAHRADFEIFDSTKRHARDYLSRGQQKVIASIFYIALYKALSQKMNNSGIILFDDPLAELSDVSLKFLLAELGQLEVQLFITSLRESNLFELIEPKVFHVKQGLIKEAI